MTTYFFFLRKVTYIISLKFKSVIHVGISSKIQKLALYVVVLSNSCTTSFDCLLINLDMRVCSIGTTKLDTTIHNGTKFGDISLTFVEIISYYFRINLKLLTFASWSSCIHRIAWYRHRASPMSTEHNGVNHMVFEQTWFPVESRMHMPNPTLLLVFEKEASTLHLNLPLFGFLHLIRGGPTSKLLVRLFIYFWRM